MNSYPFVKFFMRPTGNISSTPFIIFGNDRNICLIDSILLSNTTEDPINVVVNVARESATTPRIEIYYSLARQVNIPAYGRVDVIENKALTLEPGDLIYASCDYSQGLFDSFVTGKELTETYI